MASPATSVFLDASGRRARRLRIAAGLVGLLSLMLLSSFLFSVVWGPQVARLQEAQGPAQPLRHLPNHQLAVARRALLARIQQERRSRPPTRVVNGAGGIRGAYFAPWRDAGLTSFRAHADDLTHIYPAWLQLTPDGHGVDNSGWNDRKQTTRDLLTIARSNGVRVVPVLGNAANSQFDPKRVQAMLADPQGANSLADQLVGFVKSNGFAGLQIDFEELDASTAEKLAPWIKRLAAGLHGLGDELSISLQPDLDDRDARLLAEPCDYAVVMAYDEHEQQSGPGAIASLGYIDRSLRRFAADIGANKVVLGVGNYGYDWNVPEKTAAAITNQQAVSLAVGYHGTERPQDAVDFDPAALEPTFQYTDEQSRLHEVWFMDAVTAMNALTLARDHQVRGAALWALGMEDPSIWNGFGLKDPPVPDLSHVNVPQDVSFVGDGELLRVVRNPTPGARTIDRDRTSGLITDESYTAFPSGWLVERSGAPEKTVALTFDDGPDPTWTPKILDVLKKEGVKATFFMIGQPVADHPDIVRRVYAEGHEIGNHSFTHPNMAHVSPERVRLELSAAQRAFEATLGRSVVLFRPPYNADSEPRSYGEIMPIAVASEQGYVTAGETIDPNDWDIWRINPDGSRHHLTGQEIEQSVLQHLDYGQAVLMHDGGGDRSATLAALPDLIHQLKAQGYRFDTIGELEGHGRDATMPPIPLADRWVARVDQVAFEVRRIGGVILFWGFSTAIVLGLCRIALMIGLAARAAPVRFKPQPGARVDVLVAAYNEAEVIERTVGSLLASSDVAVRVIVVDDGSTDGTGDVVQRRFGRDPRVTLRRKANGGKASALNLALEMSDAPVVVGVDADTQLAPDALGKIAAFFQDPTIGSVAGNVKVGNRNRLVTRWQSLEYVTSQNVDRRALSRLNAITVVPGAIGAYRAEALRAMGGYRSDTLAEDMDLTWRLRRAGWRIVNESFAHAYTEAPASLGALMRQRFRWSFGTLQCLWKHRAATFHYGWFGWLALPTLWVFQFGAQILAPFVDLQLLVAGLTLLSQWISSLQHVDTPMPPDPMIWFVVGVYVAFIALEVIAGWVAYEFDDEDKRELWLLPTQRFVYRQVMYMVVWRALLRALGGAAQGWGKLKRTGAVRVHTNAEPVET